MVHASLGTSPRDLEKTLRIVRAKYVEGDLAGTFILRDEQVLLRWRNRALSGQDGILTLWQTCMPAGRKALHEAMVWLNEDMQQYGVLHADQLPTIAQMAGCLLLLGGPTEDTPHFRHPNERDAAEWAAKYWYNYYDPSTSAHSLGKAARIGHRAAQLYGLDRDEWEKRANASY